jgi:hypothetical protein
MYPDQGELLRGENQNYRLHRSVYWPDTEISAVSVTLPLALLGA